MANTWRVPGDEVPMCPDCQSDLSFVGAWTFRGLWGFNEVRTYECPTHGPIFINPQIAIRHGPGKGPDKSQDNDDRDSLIPARRKPAPTLNADAIAIPEPDAD